MYLRVYALVFDWISIFGFLRIQDISKEIRLLYWYTSTKNSYIVGYTSTKIAYIIGF